MKLKRRLLIISSLLIANWLFHLKADANISAMSQGLKKKTVNTAPISSNKPKISQPPPKPSQTQSPSAFQHGDSENLKARVSKIGHERKRNATNKLKTAVLWHAPPYRTLAFEMSPHEEAIRDLQAMETLSFGAEEKFPQIKKAKKILERNNSAIALIAKEVINQISMMTLNIDLSNFKRVSSNDDAYELVSKVNKYLYSNFVVYKKHFFINDMRNPEFMEQMKLSRANLVVVAGEDAVTKVDNLFVPNNEQAFYVSQL